jgi:site-specific DNA-methyltransferase (adenine-specific)
VTHQIIRGDCRVVLCQLPSESADLVLTDPPYGVAYRPSRTARNPQHPWRRIIGDDRFDTELYRDWLAEAYRILRRNRHFYCFASDTHLGVVRQLVAEAGFRLKRTAFWVKPTWTLGDCRGDYGHMTECIVFAHKGRRELAPPRHGNLLHFDRVRPRHMSHPTQKPIPLLRYLIAKSAPPEGVVLDPFAGSGSTGKAAQIEGRSSIQVEVDPTYVAAARRRLKTATEEELALAG